MNKAAEDLIRTAANEENGKRAAYAYFENPSTEKILTLAEKNHIQLVRTYSTRWHKFSDNSLSLRVEGSNYSKTPDKTELVNVLDAVFSTNLSADWGISQRFFEAINGSGNERTRILTIHSSSLCAFLCFYLVSKNHPFIYKGVEYTNAFFEWPDRAKGSRRKQASSLDVLLVDEKKENILAVECKFAEYLTSENADTLGCYAKSLGVKLPDGAEEFGYVIKQVLAHHVGLSQFFEAPYDEDDGPTIAAMRRVLYFDHLQAVRYMELVFDFEGKENSESRLELLKGVYAKMVSQLKGKIFIPAAKRIIVEDEPSVITYRDLFKAGGESSATKDGSDFLNPNVRLFYKL
jgi:hypothetical protein